MPNPLSQRAGSVVAAVALLSLAACIAVDPKTARSVTLYCPGAPPLQIDSVGYWYYSPARLDVYAVRKTVTTSASCTVREGGLAKSEAP